MRLRGVVGSGYQEQFPQHGLHRGVLGLRGVPGAGSLVFWYLLSGLSHGHHLLA